MGHALTIMDQQPDELFQACRFGKVKQVKRIVMNGSADLNKCSLWKLPTEAGGPCELISVTPLYMAVVKNHPAIVKCLTKAGARVDMPFHGGTLLGLTASMGFIEVARVLMKAGADCNTAVEGGWGPLHLAAGEGHSEMVRCLLEGGSDVNFLSPDGSTPLGAAALEGSDDVARILIAAGADVEKLSERQGVGTLTPLWLAAENGHTSVVRVLLNAGARPDNAGTALQGCTPLLIGAVKGHMEVVRILLEGGADITGGEGPWVSPLFQAASCGHVDVVEFLLSQGATDLDALVGVL